MQNENSTAIARYSLAVPRKFKRDGEPDCDFFNCVSFGKMGEFAERYLHKGTKVLVSGRLKADSYTNKDGQKVNTVNVIVEEQEFCESKNANGQNESRTQSTPQNNGDGWMNIPEGIDDPELPFA